MYHIDIIIGVPGGSWSKGKLLDGPSSCSTKGKWPVNGLNRLSVGLDDNIILIVSVKAGGEDRYE